MKIKSQNKPLNYSFWAGLGFCLISAAALKADTFVTFQCDMSAVGTPGAVYVNGSFNGWGTPGSPVLVNNGSDVWTNTLDITDPPGTVEQFKFWNDTFLGNWESIANREFLLDPANTADTPQVLSVQAFNVNTLPTPTLQVTFQVDMSAQVLLGNFTNNVNPGDAYGSTITVSGDFEGWDNGLPLINNPALLGSASNVYSAVLPVVAFPPDTIHYKFRMNGGWENDQPTASKNREATITSASQVLPLVFYNNNSVYDLVASPVTVTFTLNCPDGTVDDGTVSSLFFSGTFTKGVDKIYVNGNFFAGNGTIAAPGAGIWWSWEDGLGDGSESPAVEMVEVGSSDTYTNSFVIPKGGSIDLTYKYSFNGFDDENGFQTNHLRLIRSNPPTYVLPTDVWSWTVLQPGNGNPYPAFGIASTNIEEPDFGYLAIGAPTGGNFPITWLGRPGVVLENSSSLTSASWETNNVTPAYTSVTNWPNVGSAQFFRLMKYQ